MSGAAMHLTGAGLQGFHTLTKAGKQIESPSKQIEGNSSVSPRLRPGDQLEFDFVSGTSSTSTKHSDTIKQGGIFDVGEYGALRKIAEPGLDAHHVGQKALMKKFVSGYDSAKAPAILVPKQGHTVGEGKAIVSRNMVGFLSARDVEARDVRELRRVYPDAPN